MWTGRPQSLSEAATAPDGNPWSALDEFLDEFYMAYPDRSKQSAMIEAEPAFQSNDFMDAFYAAVGEHLAMRWGLDVPRWTQQPERMGAERPTFIPDLKGYEPILLVESPYSFRTRNIFTGCEPLQRARWPVEVAKVEFPEASDHIRHR